MLRLVHLPRSDADSLHAALVARMQDLPPTLMRSITWDQGTEMARHLATTDKLGAPVYFCDSRSPWQRGTNENTKTLARLLPQRASPSSTIHRGTFWPLKTNSTTDPVWSFKTVVRLTYSPPC
jgi:IS30 family transposase